ncbi:MAG: hypothetical protein ACE141_12755 [Bryobacteraceae bacterium]
MTYFLLYGVFALWVLFDSLSRRMGISAALWTAGTAVLGPIVLPIYIALRPLHLGEVREGGRAWNVLKNFAILWTIAMVVVTVAVMKTIAEVTKGVSTDAARAGAGIGIVLGIGLLAAAWFIPTFGAALLGFLLKKNTMVETGPTGPLIGRTSTAHAVGSWLGVIGAAVIGLIAVGASSNLGSLSSGSVDAKTGPAGTASDFDPSLYVQVVSTTGRHLLKDYDAGRLSDCVAIKVDLRNVSDKIIVGVKGRVSVLDGFGTELYKFAYRSDERLLPGSGSNARSEYRFDDNQFIDGEPYDKMTPLVLGGTAKYSAIVTEIAFEDGTILPSPGKK